MQIAGIAVEVVRKEIRHLHVGVYPPAGRVRVAAPLRVDDEAVRLAVVSRLGWIRRRQKGFAEQERQSQREIVTGESHYFQGRRCLLAVNACDAAPQARLVGNTTLELRVPATFDHAQRDAVLQRWYRRQLRALLPSLLAKWEPRIGKPVTEVRIRKMKTRWGSCNALAGRIWLNLELIKKPVGCLEYVLVHEWVHLHERHHNDRFLAWMDRLLPQWRVHRDRLNRAPLAHEEWTY
ncbi:MAG TPA: SprT family zinc-dependent metalloprotease [Rubrivivax sp.]|nr:SprT family zinc-dependent metalloprotease [Rubrivivax sp.]